MKRIKELLLRSLVQARVPGRLHRSKFPDSLTVLTYHGILALPFELDDWCFITAGAFRRQMMYMKKHFDVLPLADALDRLQHGEIARPTAAITFDDGYQNNFDVAFPILSEFDMPATIFLCTGLVDSQETIWFGRLVEALATTKATSLDWRGERLNIGTKALKEKASAILQAALKELDAEELNRELKSICALLRYDCSAPIARNSPFRILDAKSIGDLVRSGRIEFGAHTRSHVILTKVPDASKKEEIEGSVADVEQLTGRSCRFFAYPNGRRQDYDQICIELMKNNGICAAVTTLNQPDFPRTNLLELPRYSVGADMSFAEYQCTVHHFRGIVENRLC